MTFTYSREPASSPNDAVPSRSKHSRDRLLLQDEEVAYVLAPRGRHGALRRLLAGRTSSLGQRTAAKRSVLRFSRRRRTLSWLVEGRRTQGGSEVLLTRGPLACVPGRRACRDRMSAG